ncbi:proteinase inhibitor I4 serpin (macronuclear) [Tetrahymena thermophila SB210]|uniref:Proteinase inhibitor I4 serpin n=1 Tax=Tetrahymena thermophila (strain SB210) TaxID=312017 RepID=I7MJX1_TETTS|nr:proteinase inhibitor I4 serpin [Tetrahymena thermophila SB210]EAR97276.1 proteinase inhibitor I4 serpin [Tetrahymena thermophila SB210]|eukprot:XP_001017521.1 proteinase inhibitor I4 serpin [Tetrahymena thermophila SB210]
MQKENQLCDQIGEFAFSLNQQLSSQQNLIFSPTSIYISLALIAYGSNDKTLQEFQNVLKFQSKSQLLDIIHNAQQILINKNNIKIANNILLGIQDIQQEYQKFISQIENCSIETVDFKQNNNAIIAKINKQISDLTNNKIQNILTQDLFNEETKMILINAIYFKDSWKKQFEELQTKKQKFYTNDNKSKLVKMMNMSHKFNYYESENYQFISIPYKNKDYQLVIFLPTNQNILDFEKFFTFSSFTEALNNSVETKVNLTLPKFKINGEQNNLNSALQALGLKECFTIKADFRDIQQQNYIMLSQVAHIGKIEIDEFGTEAAAATTVVMRTKSRMPKQLEEIVMTCDKPFVYALIHEPSQLILFMGKLLKPFQD